LPVTYEDANHFALRVEASENGNVDSAHWISFVVDLGPGRETQNIAEEAGGRVGVVKPPCLVNFHGTNSDFTSISRLVDEASVFRGPEAGVVHQVIRRRDLR